MIWSTKAMRKQCIHYVMSEIGNKAWTLSSLYSHVQHNFYKHIEQFKFLCVSLIYLYQTKRLYSVIPLWRGGEAFTCKNWSSVCAQLATTSHIDGVGLYKYVLPWKMILVLSSGATAVFATAPAKAPESSEFSTDRPCLKPCTQNTICLQKKPQGRKSSRPHQTFYLLSR